MPDTVSPEATSLIAGFEGFRSAPYRDSGGVWTIGYGSTRDLTGSPVTGGTQPVTEATARILLARDALSAWEAVSADVKSPLGPDEKAALTSFVYNVGVGAFLASTLLRLLNAGDYAGAEAQFALWDRAGGKEVHGLLTRRLKEAAVFDKDVAPEATVTSSPTT
jgi:lysozyme